MPDENPAIVASETASEISVAGEAHSVRTLRARVLSGSMIMLVSSGFVGAMNLLYNLCHCPRPRRRQVRACQRRVHGFDVAVFGHPFFPVAVFKVRRQE